MSELPSIANMGIRDAKLVEPFMNEITNLKNDLESCRRGRDEARREADIANAHWASAESRLASAEKEHEKLANDFNWEVENRHKLKAEITSLTARLAHAEQMMKQAAETEDKLLGVVKDREAQLAEAREKIVNLGRQLKEAYEEISQFKGGI